MNRAELFKGKTYLHYWDERSKAFTTFDQEAGSNFSGLYFPGSGMSEDYPGGYKYWLPRSVHDAPEWVVAVKLMQYEA